MRPLGSIYTRQEKEASLAQPISFIINTRILSHEIISDYVHESILGDASVIELISENNKISINACMLETILFDDVLLKRL